LNDYGVHLYISGQRKLARYVFTRNYDFSEKYHKKLDIKYDNENLNSYPLLNYVASEARLQAQNFSYWFT
jgi:hypothetical protein